MNLAKKAAELRIAILDLVYQGKTGHIGGDLSSIDILTTLYYDVMSINPENMSDPNRDRFVLSKGHSVEALWVTLADKGFFPKEELKTFSQKGSLFIGHPNNKVNGVEMNTGSLGHGLPVCVGIALAAKMDGRSYQTYTLMGDGEQAEGSVWEGAMAAANYKLDNLTAIIDRNGLQISGTTEEVMALDNLTQKWEAFGWEVISVNGNDSSELKAALNRPHTKDKPKMIIANTIKGKGISQAENNPSWHHFVPSQEVYQEARAELLANFESLGGSDE